MVDVSAEDVVVEFRSLIKSMVIEDAVVAELVTPVTLGRAYGEPYAPLPGRNNNTSDVIIAECTVVL